MKRIVVDTAKPYEVLVSHGILKQAGLSMRCIIDANRIAVISDSNVWPLYGEMLLAGLGVGGFCDVVTCVFPAGEKSKNVETYLNILNFLVRNQISRKDCIIAFGGGVVGDLAGFAAATYLRGIDYIQIPTTLLAMVDSSVGGKTAIDLPEGKNLVGAFYQPRLVLCDPDLLNTLTNREFHNGCAEVIKYSILYGGEMFQHLCDHGESFNRETIIADCIARKRDVIVQDEYDNSQRQLLNLGHTFGHAIEVKSSYAISHGEAVAIGTALICRAAVKRGLSEMDQDSIIHLLEQFQLPVMTDISASEIYNAALLDKKVGNGKINLIIPKSIGRCEIVSIPITELKEIIEEGL